MAYKSADAFDKALEVSIKNMSIKESLEIATNRLGYTEEQCKTEVLEKIYENA